MSFVQTVIEGYLEVELDFRHISTTTPAALAYIARLIHLDTL